MMNQQFRRALVAAISIPVLSLAACGGAESAPEAGSGSPGPAASDSAKPVVNPADLMFVVMMIPHHEQAVQMSDLLLAKSGVDADVRKLAQQIKAAQQPEIDQMETWLSDRGVDDSAMGGMDHSDHMDGMLSAEEIKALTKADGPQGQKLYLQGMIAHHQGAVTMANNVLGVGQDPDIKALAENIVATQQPEIATMEKMLGR